MATKKRKGRGDPKGPRKRGIRGHRVIDQQQGLSELIDSMLLAKPRPTYKEIVERLEGSGFRIARSTLARYGYEFEITKREQRLLVEMARMLASEDPDSILELERAIAQLANVRIFKALLDPSDKEAAIKDADLDLMNVASRLQSSSSARERARMAHNRGVKAAHARLVAEIQKTLKGTPELRDKLIAKANEAAKEIRR